jgi:hypothetical protein
MSAILILGAGGFVGAHLEKLLKLREIHYSPSMHFRYDRITRSVKALDTGKSILGKESKEMTLGALMRKFEKVTVVNLMTNVRDANMDNVKEANYSTPQQILRSLISYRSEISWIQVNSYFQFYYSLYGVDKDEYSKYKRLFSDELMDLSDDSTIAVTQVYSPHLYGNFENKARITARLRDLVQGRLNKLFVSSGRQFLPLLDVRAFVSVIGDLVGEDNICINNSGIYVRPEFNYELRQICNLATSLMQDGKERISFYKQKERPNEFYSSNFVPNDLLQYDSKLTFNFLDYLSSKD